MCGFIMLMLRHILLVWFGGWFVTINLKNAYSIFRSSRYRKYFRFAFG